MDGIGGQETQCFHSYVTFKQFLCSIGVPEEVAEHDACRIEHYLSPESIKGIRGIMTRTAE